MPAAPDSVLPDSVLIVPRWAGQAEDDWYPWLRKQLLQHPSGQFRRVEVARLPRPQLPRIAGWTAALAEQLPTDPTELSRLLLVGHSVGCQAILRTLAELPPPAQVAGVLCVAGWFTLEDPWPAARPWLNEPYDLERARNAAGRVVALISDNDPYTTDAYQNQQDWRAKVGADVIVAPAAGHFTSRQEPKILQTLLRMAGAA